MALILKTGKEFNPAAAKAFGINMSGSGFYGVIDSISYDKDHRDCVFCLDIYGSKDAREKKASVMDSLTFSIIGNDFDDHIGSGGLSVPQAYLLAINDDRLKDWTSDE